MSVELLNPAHSSSSSSFAPFAKEEMSYSKTSKRIRVKFSLCCCWFLSGNPARERRTYSKSSNRYRRTYSKSPTRSVIQLTRREWGELIYTTHVKKEEDIRIYTHTERGEREKRKKKKKKYGRNMQRNNNENEEENKKRTC